MKEQNKSTAPSDKEIEKLIRRIKSVSNALDRYLVNLTPTGRRHLLKPRPGGEKVAEIVTRVAADLNLKVSGASTEEIDSNRTRATRLVPLHAAAASLAQTLDDTILDAESKAWWGTTAVYTALRGVARSDGALKAAIQPAASFFALGRRKPKAPACREVSAPLAER